MAANPDSSPALRRTVGLLIGWLVGWQVAEALIQEASIVSGQTLGPVLFKVAAADVGALVGWAAGASPATAIGLIVGWNLGITVLAVGRGGGRASQAGLLPVMIFGLVLGSIVHRILQQPPRYRDFTLAAEVAIGTVLGGALGWSLGLVLAGPQVGVSVGGSIGVVLGALVGARVHRFYRLARGGATAEAEHPSEDGGERPS